MSFEFGAVLDVPVCSNSSNPPPCGQPGTIDVCTDLIANCASATVLASPYQSPANSTCGYELTACPDGCVGAGDGGALKAGAHCR